MTRIFATLAIFAVLTMSAALVLGLYVSGMNAARTLELRPWFRAHFLLGVFAALAVVLVNCIAMTYFIGTSRWCKEVVDTYRLDAQLIERSSRLKRRTFPWALLGMLTAVVIVALGGAADTRAQGAEHWVTIHLLGACCGLALIAWSFFVQLQRIALHHLVVGEVMQEVRRVRAERGLED